ncbi:MAG: hypothetical protein AAF385_02695, partial [Pseudomonadota bacterium]
TEWLPSVRFVSFAASKPEWGMAQCVAGSGASINLKTKAKTRLVLVLLLAVVAVILISRMRNADIHVPISAGSETSTNIEAPQNGTTASVEKDPIKEQTEPEPTSSDSCLTLELLEDLPALIQDGYRLEPVMDSSPEISAYRGLSESDLLQFAAQGDSAAMAVLGAMSVMRAREWPVSKAVAYLMYEDLQMMNPHRRHHDSEDFLKHMAQARKWFYDAALHGRVLTLHRVGNALLFEQGDAVALGWIDKEEHDLLSNFEKTALMPSNVYNALAFEIVPELESGPIGETIAAILPRTERQQKIVKQLSTQFSQDLTNAGLEPITVAESTAPSREEMLKLLCASELDRLTQEDQP